MNKIDAFFVVFSIFLAWIFLTVMASPTVLHFIYWIIAAISVGVFLGQFYTRLRCEPEQKLWDELFEQQAEMLKLRGVQQAKIDSLMLEYCPDEMTKTQLINWALHQQSVPEEIQKKINDALH